MTLDLIDEEKLALTGPSEAHDRRRPLPAVTATSPAEVRTAKLRPEPLPPPRVYAPPRVKRRPV